MVPCPFNYSLYIGYPMYPMVSLMMMFPWFMFYYGALFMFLKLLFATLGAPYETKKEHVNLTNKIAPV